jgi:hypothetical protein
MKILIAAPIYDEKFYCIDAWLKYMTRFAAPDVNILLVDNSAESSFSDYVRSIAKGMEVLHIPHVTDPYSNLLNSRKTIIERLLNDGYTHLFSIECDVFAEPTVLRQLLAHKKPVVGVPYILAYDIDAETRRKQGFYYSCSSLQTFTTVGGEPTGSFVLTDKDLQNAPPLLQVYQLGLGCVLIEQEVFRQTTLRCDPEHHRFDDSFLYQDLARMGVPVYADVDCLQMVAHYPHFKRTAGWIRPDENVVHR